MSDLGSNIDKLFKEGLGKAKVNPPSSLFNSIQGQINPQTSQVVSASSKIAAKTLGVTGVKVAIISTVVTIAVAAVVWYDQSGSDSENVSIEKSIVHSDQNKTEEENPSPTISVTNSNEEPLAEENPTTESVLYTPSNSQSHIVESDHVKVENDDEEPAERIYLEDRSEEFVTNEVNEQKTTERETFILTNCGLVGAEIIIQDQTGILNLVNVSNDREDLPIEINWGDSESSRVVLGNQTEIRHKYYVLNSKEFNVDIRATGKNCIQNIHRELLIKNSSIQQGIVVPNIFTPNNDGINDSFYVEMPAPKEFVIRVIGPMKQIVFESDNCNHKWSGDFRGRRCEKGIYTVILKYKYSGDKDWKSKTSTVWLNRN